MNQVIEEKAQILHKKQKRRRLWVRLLTAMACVVVFCTTYALILPAITAETETFCGLEAHAHTDACYETRLVCGQTGEDPEHVHSSACYTMEKALICDLPEEQGHKHTGACRKTTQTLVCTEPEAPGHTHTPECEGTVEVCICELPEDEAHTHTTDCYTTETAYVCGLSETEGHKHTGTCYEDVTALVCTLPETEGHKHSEACYGMTEVRTCGISTEPTGHVHTDACYEKTLSCGKEPHTHDKRCYSDPSADVETEEIWEDTLPEELTGDYRLDVLRMAESQLGYTESTRNYTVLEDGSVKGYSRYGAWYGDHYGDWCAMFVSFCLHYAEVPGFPLDANCQSWIEALEKLEQQDYQEDPQNCHKYYVSPNGYEPEAGDIVFFNWDDTPDSDHVGLVYEFIPATDHSRAEIRTIEGNSGDRVQFVRYKLDDTRIMGYGRLPEQVFYCGKAGHVHDPDEKDCTMDEHIHEESCLIAPEAAAPVVEPSYLCGREAHVHNGDCFDEGGALICTIEDHAHTEECLLSPLHICKTAPHTHTDDCYDENGSLRCGKEEHVHTEDCFEDPAVGRVIIAIDALPTYEEIERTMDEYEAADDLEGMETWYSEVSRQVCDAYQYYRELTDAQKALVYNAEKLLALEVIWSAEAYAAGKTIVSDRPTEAGFASTASFIDLNLYDYHTDSTKQGINAKWSSDTTWPGFQWNGGAYMQTSYNRHSVDYIDFGNSMITDGQYTGSSAANGVNNGRYIVVKKDDASKNSINYIDMSDYGVNNRPAGMSLASSIYDKSYDVLQRTLSADGYPVLANGNSLKYLFTSDGSSVKKLNTASIDGLFQQDPDSGAYYYNSRWNHAQYSNNHFTLYNQIITPNFIVYPFGNFLPLNDITTNATSTQVSKITNAGTYIQSIINQLIYSDDYSRNLTKQQLLEMLAKYRTSLQNDEVWDTWSAKDAIVDYFTAGSDDNPTDDNPTDDTSPITNTLLNKMYNIDWDVETNFFFGMDMTMNFIQPKNGMTGTDNKYPMEFYFTGDDDVWVYIDGVLFLDLSGIHRHVGGKIDFKNGKVYYYALDVSKGDVSDTPYRTDTFEGILKAAGKSTDGLNEKGAFKDYSSHQFKFFYTERGSGSSVCRMNFNFPMLRQNSISISKEVSSDVDYLGGADYKFQILKTDDSGNKTNELFIPAGTKYTIYNSDDIEHKNAIGSGTTDANGIITLKAGQQALFEGITENSGKYYVRELMSGTVLEQYGNVTVSGVATTTSGNVTVGSDSFTGYDSPIKDISDGATSFRFTNTVDPQKLGTLTIEKQVTEYGRTRSAKSYDIAVSLNGVPLPEGTKYTLDGTEKTVGTAGIIPLRAGEKAVIPDILAGTAFTVQETSGSARGYVVTYTETGTENVTQNEDGVSGIVRAGASIQLLINNTEKGAVSELPVTKTLTNPEDRDGGYTYSFTMVPVADQNGTALPDAEPQTQTVTVTKDNPMGITTFLLNYVQTQLEAEGTGFPHTFYYKLTEVINEEDPFTSYDRSIWVAAVTVTEDTESSELSAAVTGLWKDGTSVDLSTGISFSNTLLGSLTLTKRVSGEGTEKFGFTITLPGCEGKTFDCTGAYTKLTFDEKGTARVSLGADETVTILGIPAGTEWHIEEDAAPGYSTAVTVDEGASTEGRNASGTLSQRAASVTYTNTTAYELPEAGGTGTCLLLLLGAALTLMSGILLFCRRKVRS